MVITVHVGIADVGCVCGIVITDVMLCDVISCVGAGIHAIDVCSHVIMMCCFAHYS